MIDYKLIDKSIKYYENLGYNRIETPWLVTDAIDSITRPKGVEPYIVSNKNKNLVASAEQGFLYLYLKGFLPKGKFQSVSPCFRNEKFDLTHTKYFIKNELIVTDVVTLENLNNVVNHSYEFFKDLFGSETMVVSEGDGFDIVYDNVELGSYGIRECSFLKWIYGTGLAEPRTSSLMYKNKIL